ncbi:MAG: GSCFA domain-containing protein [Bacteroidales bacterium]|nr:GSCFA domain-containing protein [Bacteroidales bacterium]MBO7648731.1 GSCFA domain-containing protein [Bacteroidales bacterium]MCR4858152.1 GSCFA domain-containing protein [Bacteroidales bacterium]
MIFRTNIPAPEYPFEINYNSKIMLLGSCFSDNIGSYFYRHRFQVCSNPFGVLFNPVSIDHALRLLMHPESFDKDRYFLKNRDLWVSFAHHGKFSRENFEEFERNIDEQLAAAAQFFRETDILFVTFGTAFCYKYIPRDLIVANCHKIPNYQFDRLRLDVKKIVSLWNTTLQAVREVRPDMKVVFTVSPVRHAGDGMHENSLSKAVLLLAEEKLVDQESTFYFPSYEYLVDDLRDYRFYAKDLCHPNDLAIDYLEEKVAESFFSPETVERLRAISQENRFLNHRRLRKE